MPEPELVKQTVQEQRVQHPRRSKTLATHNFSNDRLVHRRRAPLLQRAAALCRAGRVSGQEFLRRHQVEQFDAVRRDVAVPGRAAATTYHDEPVGLDLVRGFDPSNERNPVQHFVADFGQPRTDDDRIRSTDQTGNLAFDDPFCAIGRDPSPGIVKPEQFVPGTGWDRSRATELTGAEIPDGRHRIAQPLPRNLPAAARLGKDRALRLTRPRVDGINHERPSPIAAGRPSVTPWTWSNPPAPIRSNAERAIAR